MKTFGEAIRERRKAMGLRQAHLAEYLPEGWSQPKISALETGQRAPSVSDIRDLSAALEMSPEWLVSLAIRSLP